MKKRRGIVIFLTLVLMTVFLMSSGVVMAADEPTELVMVFPTFGSTPPDMDLVQEEINKIAEEEINARIKIIPIGYGSYAQQMNLMLSSGEKVDVLGILGSDRFLSFASKGHLLPLNNLLDDYGQGILEVVDPAYLQGTTIDGNILSVTALRDMAAGKGLLMRKDIIDKYNLDVNKIKELEELSLLERLNPVEEIFSKIKSERPNFTPLIPSSIGTSFLARYTDIVTLGDFYGVLLDKGKELKVVNWFETEEYKELVYRMHDWYEKGYVLTDAATNTDSQFSLIRADKGFCWFAGTKPGLETQESNASGREIVLRELIAPYTTTDNIQIISWSIPRGTTAPEKAMEFMNLMYTSADIQNLLSYGVEGKHYVVQENGLIDYPEGVNADNTGYNLNMGWMFGNQMISHIWEGNSPDLWQDIIEFNNNAYKSKSLGFVFDGSTVKTEIAALTAVGEQYRLALETGSVNPKSILPRFLSALKDAGIDKVIAEKQRQLDEWAEANNIK